jgi:hypothetical protein
MRIDRRCLPPECHTTTSCFVIAGEDRRFVMRRILIIDGYAGHASGEGGA